MRSLYHNFNFARGFGWVCFVYEGHGGEQRERAEVSWLSCLPLLLNIDFLVRKLFEYRVYRDPLGLGEFEQERTTIAFLLSYLWEWR